MIQDDSYQVWDEFRWEKHLLQFESENARLRSFIDATWGETSPPWERLMQEFPTKTEVVDAYVEEELMYEESVFPDDDDDFGDDDDDFEDEDIFFSSSEDEDDEDDEDDEGFDVDDAEAAVEEAMRSLSQDAADEPELMLYNRSRAFAAEVLHWREQLGIARLPGETNQFILDVLQISAKLAAAYWFGWDADVIGANIAYTKKALTVISSAQERLRNMYAAGLISRSTYFEFMEKLHDLRNDTGVAIQELRDLFNQ